MQLNITHLKSKKKVSNDNSLIQNVKLINSYLKFIHIAIYNKKENAHIRYR
jgi:hypothetical protein